MEQQQQQHGAAAALKLRAGTRTATRAFINPFTATLAAGCAALAVSGAVATFRWNAAAAAADMSCKVPALVHAMHGMVKPTTAAPLPSQSITNM